MSGENVYILNKQISLTIDCVLNLGERAKRSVSLVIYKTLLCQMTFALNAVGKMYKSLEFIEDSVSLRSKIYF